MATEGQPERMRVSLGKCRWCYWAKDIAEVQRDMHANPDKYKRKPNEIDALFAETLEVSERFIAEVKRKYPDEWRDKLTANMVAAAERIGKRMQEQKHET